MVSSLTMLAYRVSPTVTDAEINELFAVSWPDHRWRPVAPWLGRSLLYVCAYAGERLIGFVNLAWDGGVHTFLLDTTVHPEMRRQGIGQELVRRAVDAARGRGIEWIHVDYESYLDRFYTGCGFRPAQGAGLIRLDETAQHQ